MRALVRFLAYQIASWLAITSVVRGLWWGAPMIVALVALYTTVPLLLFIRWRGWPFYPGATFRLLVVRAVLYTQLMLPFVAGAAVTGMLIGLPFGMAMQIGHALTGAVVGSGALVQPQQSWRTETVSLVWEHGWRVTSFASTSGPTPPLPQTADATTTGDLFAEIPRFTAFSHAEP